jgi:uncharacterized PurR-regulated membrane protein YhhQ (DUF165 family)
MIVSVNLALASGATFLFAETMETVVFTPLRRRALTAALCATVVGATLDSTIFVGLAFGARAIPGLAPALTVGKLEWSILALPLVRSGGVSRTQDDAIGLGRGP